MRADGRHHRPRERRELHGAGQHRDRRQRRGQRWHGQQGASSSAAPRLLGTDTVCPYTFTWNNVAAGSYALTARATDNAGAVTTSSHRERHGGRAGAGGAERPRRHRRHRSPGSISPGTTTPTNETGFRIERSTNGNKFTQIATVGANVTTYASTGLGANKTYYYRVRATNAARQLGVLEHRQRQDPAPVIVACRSARVTTVGRRAIAALALAVAASVLAHGPLQEQIDAATAQIARIHPRAALPAPRRAAPHPRGLGRRARRLRARRGAGARRRHHRLPARPGVAGSGQAGAGQSGAGPVSGAPSGSCRGTDHAGASAAGAGAVPRRRRRLHARDRAAAAARSRPLPRARPDRACRAADQGSACRSRCRDRHGSARSPRCSCFAIELELKRGRVDAALARLDTRRCAIAAQGNLARAPRRNSGAGRAPQRSPVSVRRGAGGHRSAARGRAPDQGDRRPGRPGAKRPLPPKGGAQRPVRGLRALSD